jgi:hypothetical protein
MSRSYYRCQYSHRNSPAIETADFIKLMLIDTIFQSICLHPISFSSPSHPGFSSQPFRQDVILILLSSSMFRAQFPRCRSWFLCRIHSWVEMYSSLHPSSRRQVLLVSIVSIVLLCFTLATSHSDPRDLRFPCSPAPAQRILFYSQRSMINSSSFSTCFPVSNSLFPQRSSYLVVL